MTAPSGFLMPARDDTIYPDRDSLETVARKLSFTDYQWKERLIPNQKQLRQINGECDDHGNSLLIKFAEHGQSDIVEFLLKIDEINVNHRNRYGHTAADKAWDNKQFVCLVKLLEADSFFPDKFDDNEVEDENLELKDFLRKRETLHARIKEGDLKGVEDCLRSKRPSAFLSKINESALFCAAKERQIEIVAILLNVRAKFGEDETLPLNIYEKEKLNSLLEDQFQKVDDHHVLKLFGCSKSPQVLSGRRYGILQEMYEYLKKFESIELIMKVLEFVDIDVVFDFEHEYTDNIYWIEDRRIKGVTVPSSKTIFIGAKKCLDTVGMCKEVAGTLAHELCHMAMHVLGQ